MRSSDNLCKYLAETYPEAFVEWLLHEEPGAVQVLKTELGLEPIRADSVTFVQTQSCILHLEFQVEPQTQPPLPLRMLDYWVRLHRRYQCEIVQVLILLKPTTIEVPKAFISSTTRHDYRVVKLWEEEPEQFFENSALLAFATLARAEKPRTLLETVAERVSQIEPMSQRQEVSMVVQILAGLKYEKELIQSLFREGMMRESVMYQEILAEGREEGIQLGKQEGIQLGKQEGRQEGELLVILRQMKRRFGELPTSLETRLKSLKVAEIETLAEAIFDFSDIEDVQQWLGDL